MLPHPNQQNIVVVAGGTAYVVDPAERKSIRSFGGDIQFAAHLHALDALVVGNGLWFEYLPADGPSWQTRRISWDGMRDVRVVDGPLLTGEAYSPLDDGWHSFTVDLVTREVEGGSYNGPEM